MSLTYVMCDHCKHSHHRDETILAPRGLSAKRICLRCVEVYNRLASDKRALLEARRAA